MKSCAFVGTGQQLIACAESWVARGHRITAVVSDCPEVSAWAPKRGIPRIGHKAPSADGGDPRVQLLARAPIDFLFSIVNHTILTPEILALPRVAAINYHDSPLPLYAGFNATAWAILEGQTEHAVTWHEMTAKVDAGRILLQVPVPIATDDTAFTLAAKCSNAGVQSFATLMDIVVQPPAAWPSVDRTAIAPSFHLRAERPGAAILDFRRPADELALRVRALNFGTDDNWMCRPKVLLPSSGYLVVGESDVRGPSPLPAGTVTNVGPDGFEVVAGGTLLWLGEVATLEGERLSGAALAERLGVRASGATGEDTRLPFASDVTVAAADALDKVVTRNERFWVERLTALEPAQLSDVRPHPGTRQIKRQAVRWPTGATGERQRTLLTAFVAYLGRVGNARDGFDLAFERGLVSPELTPLYRSAVPLRTRVNPDAPATELRAALDEELAVQERRGTVARDVVQRYRVLRDVPEDARALPIGVRLVAAASTGPAATTLPPGVFLALEIPASGDEYAFVYDEHALPDASARPLFARIGQVLALLQAEPTTRVGDLSITTPEERALLLGTWQDTTRPFAHDRCVHELFEAQVQRTPDQTALVFRGESLSYRQLDQRANALAHVLAQKGVGPDVLVGICIERSLYMVVGLIAIHKAGGAYVPLDPVYPKERLAIMLEDSQAKVLVTERRLSGLLPSHGADVVLVDDPAIAQRAGAGDVPPPARAATPDHLAYVIFTSGSTGRPKGVMIQHRNVANFFAGMDDVIGTAPGVWLAVTSMSFDISVLELFWTLCRGFKVIVQEESDRRSLAEGGNASNGGGAGNASGASAGRKPRGPAQPMGFGLFYFAADSTNAANTNAYRLLLEGAKFADQHGFEAVWTPERHFHAFGGLYPNPAVTTAALAVITKRIELRAGSVVLPLHNPIRVAEDWAVVDNLSGGRVGLSFASGWHVNDFALMPQNFQRRREVMFESIETVLKLWRGEKITVDNGEGKPIQVAVLPRPVRERPPMWIASAGSIETFRAAGKYGCNLLTNMLGQDLEDLRKKFIAYRDGRKEAGHAGPGIISVMLHTFVCGSDEEARRLARKPFCDYLASSYDLVKVAPWMFPAFKPPSQGKTAGAPETTTAAPAKSAFDPSTFDADDMAALMDHAFERYYETAGLFGTPERAVHMIDQLKGIGATEVACLIDFGIEPQVVLDNLVHLERLRQLANADVAAAATAAATPADVVGGGDDAADYTIAAQMRRQGVTHFQCTPSMARMLLVGDPAATFGGLRKMLVGGEALPTDLLDALSPHVKGDVINMYGPTETTVWSTSSVVRAGTPITIGRPIANTVIRILDERQRLMPVGTPGELCIGGQGVVRGYLGRPDLTAERFVADPHAPGARLYRTGDLARFRGDGEIEFIGRLDQQVKVNGYRIELGEIETVIGRHPLVRQSTVVVRKDDHGSAQLVAYLVAQTGAGDAAGAAQSNSGTATAGGAEVDAWQARWNQAYGGNSEIEARFNTAGWLSSYDGAPIAKGEMREWLDATRDNVVGWTRGGPPQRVLEIGCGTGMILYAVLPHVAHYTAVDVAPRALELIERTLTTAERGKVALLNLPAHQLAGVPDRGFDTAVINSVAQYFPSAAYLEQVITRVAETVSDGGRIFVGDVRALEQLDLFATMVEVHQAPGQRSLADMGRSIDERIAAEPELLLAPAFFAGLVGKVPRVAAVELRLKRGVARNEMSAFRYDVLLHVGSTAPAAARTVCPPTPAPGNLDPAAVTEMLRARPPALWITGVPNARVSAGATAKARIDAARGPATNAKIASVTADELRDELALGAQAKPAVSAPGIAAGFAPGVDPEALIALASSAGYDVELRPTGRDTFDAVFRRQDVGDHGVWPHPAVAAAATTTGPVANVPAQGAKEETLVPKLRAHLREFLPEYMVPSAFVVLDRFPLTPNGKVDKKALPAPEGKKRATAAYVTPAGELEQTIASVWQALLGVERVGRKDNIFDLGASSLLTVEANAKLSALLGRKIPLVNMFRYPTIETLATALGGAATGITAKVADQRKSDREERERAAIEKRRLARARQS